MQTRYCSAGLWVRSACQLKAAHLDMGHFAQVLASRAGQHAEGDQHKCCGPHGERGANLILQQARPVTLSGGEVAGTDTVID